MKQKKALIISIIGIITPIISVIISMLNEPEIVEAVAGGLFLGSIIGSVFGVTALIINKGKSLPVIIFSILPMCPLAVYLMLLLITVRI